MGSSRSKKLRFWHKIPIYDPEGEEYGSIYWTKFFFMNLPQKVTIWQISQAFYSKKLMMWAGLQDCMGIKGENISKVSSFFSKQIIYISPGDFPAYHWCTLSKFWTSPPCVSSVMFSRWSGRDSDFRASSQNFIGWFWSFRTLKTLKVLLLIIVVLPFGTWWWSSFLLSGFSKCCWTFFWLKLYQVCWFLSNLEPKTLKVSLGSCVSSLTLLLVLYGLK